MSGHCWAAGLDAATTIATSSITSPAHLKIFQRVIRTEDIQKNLMNDFESQYDSDGCSDPVHIKEPGVISQAVNRKYYTENDDLRNYVGKKDGELSMQLSPKHHPRHRDLQGGVCQPEYVVGELCARAH